MKSFIATLFILFVATSATAPIKPLRPDAHSKCEIWADAGTFVTTSVCMIVTGSMITLQFSV
jgi:hypothetical protein